MLLTIADEKEINPKYIKVSAQVRYWDDAEINGESDENGVNVPFKNGDLWEPTIDIDAGTVIDWPENTSASFHFKVCDAGNYFLLDSEKTIIAERYENYVPDGLCHGDNGHGDYIIFSVDTDGKITAYKNKLNGDDWNISE